MRRLFFLIISIISIIHINAQHEFAPIGAKWYFDKVEDWNPPDEGYVTFTSVKDTTINGLSSRILHKMYYTSRGDTIDWGKEYLHQSGDTIFYLIDGEFRVLYNFSLIKGDTMQFYSSQSSPCSDSIWGSVKVDSVFMHTVPGYDLKGMLCSPIEGSAWEYFRLIEKIGHFAGFYPYYVNSCGLMDDISLIGGLRCYCENEIVMYKSKPCDTLIVYKTNVENKNEKYVQIFPAYTSEEVNINLLNPDFSGTIYKLYSIDGKEVLSGNLITSETIDVSNFNPGIYIIKLFLDNNTIITKKFIKLKQ